MDLNIDQIPCLCCGTCCKKYQPWLKREEIDLIASRLGISQEQFLAEYTDPRWPGTESFLLRHIDGACIFLEYFTANNQSLCRIHAFKPDSCRAWVPGIHKPECQAGLKNIWGLSVKPSGKFCGPADRLQAFGDYLNSLEIKNQP